MGAIDQQSHTERRRSPRSDIRATAVVFSRERMLGTYQVRDLSAGGAFLVGATALSVGSHVSMFVQLPCKALDRVSARVVRSHMAGIGQAGIGVAFEDLAAEQEDAIHQALVAELERMHAQINATVLMMTDHRGGTHDALKLDLLKLGHGTIAAETPLDALACLQRCDAKIHTLMIDLAFRPAQGVEMLHYLAEQHPDIRRIGISGGDRTFRLELALMFGRAHAILRKPWSSERLLQVLGREQEPSLMAVSDRTM